MKNKETLAPSERVARAINHLVVWICCEDLRRGILKNANTDVLDSLDVVNQWLARDLVRKLGTPLSPARNAPARNDTKRRNRGRGGRRK